MGNIKGIVLLKGIYPIVDSLLHTRLSYWYSRIKRMLTWSPEKITEWQTDRMRQLVRDAYDFSPYYHDLFDSLSIRPESIRTWPDLEKIPPLTKEIVREHYDDLLLRGKKGLHYEARSTGGSTGNPSRYIKDKNSWGFINAFNILMWEQAGYDYGSRFLALGSSSLFPDNKKSWKYLLYYALRGKVPFNAMNMSPEVLAECVGVIRKKRIHFIYGYATSVYLLAKYVEDHQLSDGLDIKACFTTSEVLTDTYRKTIERVFRCPVSDMYGAHDGGICAHRLQGGYKVGYNCFVQIEGGGSSGTALLTDVLSTAFPVIRYRVGDELTLGNGYNEFFNGQVLEKVNGRTSDIIRLENGRVLTGPGFTVLFSAVPVRGYRIYKSAPMQLTVEIVPEKEYGSQDEEIIVGTMHKHAGDDCDVIVRYSDSIITRSNGKNLYFLT